MCPVAVACEPQHNALISISSVCENMRILANIMIMSVLCGCVCVCARVCANMRCRLQRNSCAQIALLSSRFLEMVQRCVALFPVSRINLEQENLLAAY